MKAERCPHCKRRMTRTSQANRRYWSLLHVMADKLRPQGQGFSAESWHLYAKSRFLGCTDFTLPNGKVVTIPKSTADLDVAEFNTYMEKVEVFANEHGAYLEDAEFA